MVGTKGTKNRTSAKRKTVRNSRKRRVPKPRYVASTNPFVRAAARINQRAEEKGGKIFIIAGVSLVLLVVLLLLVFKGPLAGQAVYIDEFCNLEQICLQGYEQTGDYVFSSGDANPAEVFNVTVAPRLKAGDALTSTQFTLDFDPTVLQVSAQSPLISTWLWDKFALDNTIGEITYTAMADPANLPLSVAGLNGLIEIEFTVIGVVDDTSPLAFVGTPELIDDNSANLLFIEPPRNAIITIVADTSGGPLDCGDVINAPGTYTLDGPLTCSVSTPTALTITSDDVTLNCGAANEISGPGAAASGTVGIKVESPVQSNVVVENCVVKDFEQGIVLDSASGVTIQNNDVSTSIGGIVLYGSNGNSVLSNSIHDLEQSSADIGAGISVFQSDSNTVQGNTLLDNVYSAGIVVAAAANNDLNTNTVSNNLIGLYIGSETNPSTLIDVHGNTICSNIDQDVACVGGSSVATASPNTFQTISTDAYTLNCLGWPQVSADYNLCSSNNDPMITSTPPDVTIAISDLYNVQVVASDPDGDSLVYSLDVYDDLSNLLSLGPSFIGPSGEVNWPAINDPSFVGRTYLFEVTVDDQNGGVVTTQWHVTFAPAVNVAPVWTALFGTQTAYYDGTNEVGVPFTFDTSTLASDPSDVLTYSVVLGPTAVPPLNAFSIDSATGIVSWMPTADDLGVMYHVDVKITDTSLAAATQTLDVFTEEDEPPYFSNTFDLSYTVELGDSLTIPITTVDPDGESVNVYVVTTNTGEVSLVSAPDTWEYLWVPTELGLHQVMVEVTDGIFQVQEVFDVLVVDSGAPEICDNSFDDDGDGDADCGDTDCSADSYCLALPAEICTGGLDEDLDTLVDCDDVLDCSTHAACTTSVLAEVTSISATPLAGGPEVSAFTVDNDYLITITVGPVPELLPTHLVLAQITNVAGEVQSLFYQNQPSLVASGTETVSFSFTPTSTDTYTVDAFVWSGLPFDVGAVALLGDEEADYSAS